MSEELESAPNFSFEFQDNDDLIEMLDSFIDETNIGLNRSNTEVSPVIDVSIQADRVLWKMGQIQANIDDFEKQRKLAMEFYQAKVDREQRKLDFLKVGLEGYAKGTGDKTTDLPNGVLRLRDRQSPTYPPNENLLQFSHDNAIETNVNETPNKKAILKYIKDTGDAPEGFEMDTVTSFSVSLNSKEKQK